MTGFSTGYLLVLVLVYGQWFGRTILTASLMSLTFGIGLLGLLVSRRSFGRGERRGPEPASTTIPRDAEQV